MGIGDELVVTGQCRILQQKDPRKVKIVYEKNRWHEMWDNNPRIAHPKEDGNFQVLRPREGWKRPYIADKTDRRWTWQRWGPEWGGCAPVGEIYFTRSERECGERNAGKILIEPHLKKGASPNKNWGWSRWVKLARALRQAGLPVAQIGPPGLPALDGIEQIRTPSIRQAAAILSTARGAVLPEGALHHVAAAVKTPATVVIFGCYISDSITGYAGQTSLFTGEGLGCGSRIPAKCCEAAMAKIGYEMVADELMKRLAEGA